MKKNVSGQKVGAQLTSATDGSNVTTGTTTVYVTLDAGTQATGTVGSGAATHEGNGYWTYAPSQAETNGDLVAFTFVNTSAISATVQIYTSFPQTADAPTAAAVANAVWDEMRSGHTTVGTFGEVSAPADIADAVWDEALSGHTTAGSAGKAVADILDDTGTAGVVVAAGSKTGYSLTQSFPTNFASMSITAAGLVATVSNIKKNQALTGFMFVMRDSTTHAPVTGKTVTMNISKDGGAFAAIAGSVTEVSNGWYKCNFTATELNANVVALRATATTSDDFVVTIITEP